MHNNPTQPSVMVEPPSPGPIFEYYHSRSNGWHGDQLEEHPRSETCTAGPSTLNEEFDPRCINEFHPEILSQTNEINGPYSQLSRASSTALSSGNDSILGRIHRGGRPRGSHLPIETKENAQSVRHEGSCWRCFFMRIKVSERLGHRS